MFNKRKINKLFKAVDLELNNKNFDKALIFVNNILSLDENNFNALYKKAVILYNKGEYDESLSLLDNLLSMDYSIDSLLLKGRIYCSLGDYRNSLNSYKDASENFDFIKFNQEMIYYAEHPSLFDGGIYTKIFLNLCNIILDNEDIIEVRLFKSYVLSENNRNEDALNNINYILLRDPNNEKAIALKSSILLKINELDDATVLIEEGLNLNPNNLQLVECKARLLYENGKYDEAEKLCNQFNLQDEFGNYYLLSKIKYKKKDYVSALYNINKALDKFFESPYFEDKKDFSYSYHWYKSLILLKMEEFEESNKIIDCLIDKEENVKYYCLKAKILYEMNDYEASLKFVNKTLDLDSNCSHAKSLKEKIEKQI